MSDEAASPPIEFRAPATLVVGRGAASRLPAILGGLGARRPLIVTDRCVAAAGPPGRLARALAEAGFAPRLWDGVDPDPSDAHVRACARRLRRAGCDAVVAVGGGSVIDVGKAAAMLASNGGDPADYYGFDRVRRPALPLVAVPTTPGSGAEVSSHAVIVHGPTGKKEVVAALELLPRAALVDPAFTETLSPDQVRASALDGLIHAIEAYLARRATPLTDAFARMGLPLLARSLPRLLRDGRDAAARDEVSLGGVYAGIAMANANAGAMHALGYPLTMRCGVPHGLANALVAPGVAEVIWRAAPERAAEVCRVLDGDAERRRPPAASRFPGALRRFLERVGVTLVLDAPGAAAVDVAQLAREAMRFRPVLANAPRAVTEADAARIYRSLIGSPRGSRAARPPADRAPSRACRAADAADGARWGVS